MHERRSVERRRQAQVREGWEYLVLHSHTAVRRRRAFPASPVLCVCVYIDPRMQRGFLLNIYLSTSRRMYDSVFGRW
jgi:hypothetical protein